MTPKSLWLTTNTYFSPLDACGFCTPGYGLDLGQQHASLIAGSQDEGAVAAWRHMLLTVIAGVQEAGPHHGSTFQTSDCIMFTYILWLVTWPYPTSIRLGGIFHPWRGWSGELRVNICWAQIQTGWSPHTDTAVHALVNKDWRPSNKGLKPEGWNDLLRTTQDDLEGSRTR